MKPKTLTRTLRTATALATGFAAVTSSTTGLLAMQQGYAVAGFAAFMGGLVWTALLFID